MSKRTDLIAMLSAGWVEAPHIMETMAWRSHTLRGVISTLGTKERLKIEHRWIDGVTSYRIAAERQAETPIADVGIADAP